MYYAFSKMRSYASLEGGPFEKHFTKRVSVCDFFCWFRPALCVASKVDPLDLPKKFKKKLTYASAGFVAGVLIPARAKKSLTRLRSPC